MQAWNGTLHNLLTILGSTPGTQDAVLSIARNIRTKNADLFEDSKKILNKVSGILTFTSSFGKEMTSAMDIKC